jgi:hypothetical protein
VDSIILQTSTFTSKILREEHRHNINKEFN